MSEPSLFHKEGETPYLQVALTEPELLETISVLKFAVDAYNYLSTEATTKGETGNALNYSVKAEKALIVYSRFTALAEIGRPVNDIPH